ncbi:hypothetical protein O181_097580 [Austropuccinia psidii MF-1]|uniref:Uncharacterized protein n=1 Tax=Austropuccinia psidii MF-1 TaxID=1389203 RepID=A0A9Q3J7Q1_9BASI|nr:hypothetical protein [Austropuccinia psidii MF-1]
MSKGTFGERKIGLLGKIFQFLRPLPLMVLQGIPAHREVARWINFRGLIPIGGRPIYSSSEVPISRINTECVVKRIRQIANSPTNPDAKISDELDGEVVKVVLNSSGHQSSTSPSQPAAKRFQSQLVPSTPRNFQPVLPTIPSSSPPLSPSPSTASPALVLKVRPSHIPQPRGFPMVTSQQLQPVASSSRRREDQSHFLFPSTQVFQ